ncbi:MAG TPA: HAD-IA family hydrolase, partial [Nitrospira sp.]|nr:HAD-IA family hydrolase [Nitrospira sp.]
HAAKPSPKIFQLALEKHVLDPEEALYVGDSLHDDVEGATKAGLRAVLLDRHGKHTEAGVQRILTLEELVPLAEGL